MDLIKIIDSIPKKNLINEFDLSNIEKNCKICLQEKADHQMFPLLSMITYKGLNIPSITIMDMLTTVCPISDADDTLNEAPNLMCLECLGDLKNAYLFILRFNEAKGIVKKYLEISDIQNEEETVVENDTDEHNMKARKTTRKRKKRKDIDSDDEIKESTSFTMNEAEKETQENYPLHVCPICPKEFTTVEDLMDHAKNHKTLKKYLEIPQENQISSSVRFYATPRATTSFINQEEKLHKCIYCNEEFTAEEFNIHLDKHRKEDEFKCDKCDRVFRKINHLNMHRIKHLKDYPYKCEQCGKGFVVERNFDCHILTHKNEELPHACKYCYKRFSNPEHLNRHQIIHTENVTYSTKYKVCKCHHCLKTFRDRDELKEHNCVPVGQAYNVKFPCKSCKKVFRNSSGLYSHVRSSHNIKKVKQLCSVCGCYVSNIYNHMVRHTGEKRFKCELCEKRFVSKQQLRQHLIVHSGLKPYVCSVCAKAFNNLYNLQVHERIHKGDKCHICNICNKGFLEKSYLRKHMNVHTKL